ncbi:MAG: ABC transporter substrate-binding protein [Sphaerochaeta sp.]|nr:ABC transporter substrate-binding protein [Sphaerochaeta sp.]
MFLLTLLGAGCARQESQPARVGRTTPFQFSDDLQRRVLLTKRAERVVALSSSFAQTWLLAGGVLIGVTSDAFSREALGIGEEVALIGTIKDPNSEAILALEPDFVLLSADIPSHLALSALLTECSIPHAYFHVETLDDYLAMLSRLTTLTGEEELFKKNGLDVHQSCTEVLAGHTKGESQSEGETYLLLRAYSTKVRAKGGDTMVGEMLRQFGYTNLTELHPSLLEELGIETILKEDPTHIFVIPMGDERSAKASMEHMLTSNPAFKALGAVKDGRYHLLPKDLFHYKPNNRWEESYAYLAHLLSQ